MNTLKSLFFLLFAVVIVSCSGDDNYTPIVDDTATTDDSTDDTATTDDDPDPIVPVSFLATLSEMDLFDGELSALTPKDGVYLYELHSTLFTDYAKKQRLIKLPGDLAMEYAGDDLLPDFPDNTMIAKTFYYDLDETNPAAGKKIIETRILLKIDGLWEVGNYLWNETQTEATFDEDGGTFPITYVDGTGATRNVDYMVPSRADCAICHFDDTAKVPIGPKLRNLNFNPNNEYVTINQLQFFIDNGALTFAPDPSTISVLPDWQDDVAYSLSDRARGYMDINCAHCHNPTGVVAAFGIDMRLETAFDETLIYENRGEIEARFLSTLPTYRMPQLGRTVVHEEAATMLVAYLESLD
ncbi:MAG: hypothetical protein ABJM06_14270 [Gilvibacter sp.]